jgi:HAD superfamily hydrolase (TIGR01549 family)
MIKVISFDLDDTLCDTQLANFKGLEAIECKINLLYGDLMDSKSFAHRYNEGIHRRLTSEEETLFYPILCERTFRLSLINYLLKKLGLEFPKQKDILAIQFVFDETRIKYFDFYPGVEDLLLRLQKEYRIVVITNGPTFSQYAKIDAINLKKYAEVILIGGEETYEKPHKSIFYKALSLINCTVSEAIHIGDSYSCDIVGGHDAGLKTVWVTSSNNNSGLVADFTIESVLSLEYVLSGLNV